MADEQTPYSPAWWLKRLNDQLDARNRTISRYDRYYRGDHDLKFASVKFRTTYGHMFLDASDNWMPLVVDSVQERLRIEGFRLGKDTKGDERVWALWQANNLDADSDVLHTESLINGVAYTLVWPDPTSPKVPLITIEHPSQMIVAHAPGNRRERVAAFKKWVDDDEYVYATLYLSDFIYKFRSRNRFRGGAFGPPQWNEREVDGEPWPLPNPFGRIPVTPIANQRRMLADGESELGLAAMGLQDKINKLVFDMMVASEFAAYRQRYTIGVDIPRDDKTGEKKAPFDIGVDRLLMANPKLNQKGDPVMPPVFGEFGATDLNNYVVAIDNRVQALASVTRTPPHYLNSGADRLSGESIVAAETGLVAKVHARQRSYGEGWEDTMRLAMDVVGIRPRGGAASMELLWADAQSRTEAQHIDATVKKLALGVPLRQLWRDANYSEEEIAGFAAMLVEEAQWRAQMPAPPIGTVTLRETDPNATTGVPANGAAPPATPVGASERGGAG